MRDKYNLNTLPPSLAGLEDYEMDDHVVIPGMGMTEDRLEFGEQQLALNEPPPEIIRINNAAELAVTIKDNAAIPGLDLDVSAVRDKKLPYKKPISKSFQAHWNIESKSDEFYGTTASDSASILACVRDVIKPLVTRLPGVIPLEELKPQKIQIYGKDIEVIRK